MTEPYFGTAQPMWAAIASPGFGWAAPPVGAGNPGPAQPLTPAAQFSGFGAFPAFPAATIPAVVTAGTVLAAVAMRRGQPGGPTTDAEIEDFLYDALDLIPGTSDAEVRCEGGRVTLSGSVPHKRQKHDVGEIAWAIPSVTDVQNSVTIAARRRARAAGRENEAQTSGPVRKHG